MTSTTQESDTSVPVKLELAGQSRVLVKGTTIDVCNLSSSFVLSGPNNECDLIVRVFPATLENNFCKDTGCVVSKNAAIQKVFRAVQGNNLCLRIRIRASSKFKIRFFDKNMKILNEFMVDTMMLSSNDEESVFQKLDSIYIGSSQPLPSQPFVLQTIIDMESLLLKRPSKKMDKERIETWRAKIATLSTCGELWQAIKDSIPSIQETQSNKKQKL